jgi:fructose-1,6-bisphosphatase II
VDAGHNLDRVLSTDDLVSSDDAFFAATGITDGELLKGVRYRSGGAATHTLVTRARSGTIRNIHSEHALWKVSRYSVVPYLSASRGAVPADPGPADPIPDAANPGGGAAGAPPSP